MRKFLGAPLPAFDEYILVEIKRGRWKTPASFL
jgi:hypothetical protein